MNLLETAATLSDPLDDEERSLGFRPVSLQDEKQVTGQLGALVADRAFTHKPDREFQAHVRGQFDKVFPDPKPLHDDTGRMRQPRAATTNLDPFKPKPDPANARPRNSVGIGGANRPDDVWGFKKALSAATNTGLDLTKERSEESGAHLIKTLKGFQKVAGLKVDGFAGPDGPTAKALDEKLSNTDGQATGISPSNETEGAEPNGKRPIQTAQSNPPSPPGLPVAPPKNVARIIRYSDGRLYLPLSKFGGHPLTVGGKKAVIRDDLALVRRTHDLPLDNQRTSKASQTRSAPNEKFVVVMRRDQSGNWFGPGEILTDPNSHERLRAFHPNMYRLSPSEVRKLGLEDWSSITRKGSSNSGAPRSATGNQSAGNSSGSSSVGNDILRIIETIGEAIDLWTRTRRKK